MYNESTLHPRENSLADPRMGVNHSHLICNTCECKEPDCPGHFGHIELELPVYHIGFLDKINKVLRCVCYYCSKLLPDKVRIYLRFLLSKEKTRI